ncbi:hypothetical protein AAVH_13406 [Aphelenchoides avenae]|nr:hypothetical protein AAVH_13406 [Aphelenchus avenae]
MGSCGAWVLSDAQRTVEVVLLTGSPLQLPERNFVAAEPNGNDKITALFTPRNASVEVCVTVDGHSLITNDPQYFTA